MLISDVLDVLERWAPPALQESYDNSGLIVGDRKAELRQALICLDVTPEVIEEARIAGANLIIAHHPVLFTPLKHLTGSNWVERVIMEAIRHGIAIYAVHTNLDHVASGVNARICQTLGISGASILRPKKDMLLKLQTYVPKGHLEAVRNAVCRAGAGQIGEYDGCSFSHEGTGTFRASDSANPFVGEKGQLHLEPETKLEVVLPIWAKSEVCRALLQAHPYEEVAYDLVPLLNEHTTVGSGMVGDLEHPLPAAEFIQHVKKAMKAPMVRHTEAVAESVQRIAVCGGSGSFLLEDAVRAGADVLLTSDFKYHQFFDADKRLMICDIGHFEGEQFTIPLIAEKLTQEIDNFAPLLTRVNTNPVLYS